MTPTPPPQSATTLLQEKSALISQTNQGPGLKEVGAKLLRDALSQQYPELAIDPDRTLIVTPQWQASGDSLISLEPLAETLTVALIRQSKSSTVANFIEGEHFLTLTPLSQSPVQLAVSIEDIANLLNTFAPVLYIEFQQQQLDYWNEPVNQKPRWHELSDTLRKALNLQQVKGWTADQCEVARAVSAHPDKAERAQANTTIPGIQACLIDIDYNAPDNSRHLLLGGAIVLKATHTSRDMLLLYTIEGGYEAFESMQTLSDSLPARIGMDNTGQSLQWRLFEPDGSIFDYMAWALIAGQVEAIAALKSAPDSPYVLLAPGTRGVGHFSDEEKRHLDQLQAAIPDWLANASAADLQAYGHYLSNQGRLRNVSGLNDIKLIADYAQEQMRNAIVTDRLALHGNDAADLPLDELQITITNSFTVGAFTLPNPLDVQVETLGEFALQNTAPYQAELTFKDNQPCPDWLTVAYLVDMAQQVNVGKRYPAMLKTRLIDDPGEAARQQQHYVNLLPDLLRLKALECKLQNECGVDETGYRYVCELIETAQGRPPKDLLDVVVRPLSFVPRHRLLSTGDTVANMFIIGPRRPHSGPSLLYRPALEQPLLQFTSLQNMIYALHQPGELRDSVLAWLPTPTLGFEYSQYVFPVGLPSPWLATETGIEQLLNLDLSGPISLGTEEITGDLLPTLFASNANTLVEQADRLSLSNGERRWALLRDSGWAIFNVASTFLTGPVGTAAWVWQSIGQLQQGLEARERGDSLVEWTSLGDVLMTLGMLLIHRASLRRTTEGIGYSRNKRKNAPAQPPASRPLPAPTVITLDATVLSGELPAGHDSELEAGASIPRRTPSALGVYLNTLKVRAPDMSDVDLVILNVTPPHLYQLQGKQYARAGQRWFQVRVNDDEQVVIFNSKAPARGGPLLTHDRQGNWYVDTRLRLRGGGLKSRLKSIQLEKGQRRDALQAKLQAFKSREGAILAEIRTLQEKLMRASGDQFDSEAKALGDRLEVLIDNHREALEQLHEWRELGGTFGYAYDLLRLTTLLEKHLALWFSLKSNDYSRTIAPFTGEGSLNPALPVGSNRVAVKKAIELSHGIIQRLALAHNALDGLKVLGRAALESSQAIRKLLPRHSALDYKANEIGLAYELCVKEQPGAPMPQARDAVANIVIEAAEASQKLADIDKAPPLEQTAEQRIAALTPLLDAFADTLQRIDDLPAQFPGRTHPEALLDLQTLIKEFQALAQARLYALLPEDELLFEAEPNAPVAGPSHQPGKVTKTRPRDALPASESVPEAATFKKLVPKSETPSKPVRADIDVISDGLNLNLDLDGFIARTREDAQRANRIPADMQHLFDSQALKYEEEAAAVEIASANIRAATGVPPPVATLSRELRDAAARLRSTGISVRAAMLKQRKPRLAYFQWLHENGQIGLVRNPQGRIKTKSRGDYFQEYRILDTTRNDQPLWVAHFHYDTLNSPVAHPTAAHLKIADGYLATLDPVLRQQLTSIEPVDYVFRRISDPAIRALFMALEPAAPPLA
ncbi:dermonecrotic toxin domain-containing protein [Pseudomonas frederiksbergensis]|uniref:Dermonecrotic toxin N-terminal domain-containing protein n=1 Tax=Pseudomonas frederiksbergensis TaxID=104087 RepID=A0A423KEM4_9PSED|nr:DUF6543 domain-containing protein [Pseudomonas frederiksbergensis]RON51060.1 hypothetical protein BK665_20040 [Pseudomonas frederiksbergensis]